MGYGFELKVPKNEKMMLKAKLYLESLQPEEFESVEELVSYIAYLHMLSGDYLETLAEIIAQDEEKLKH